MARGIKGLDAAASVLFALSLVGLTGCGDLPWNPDHWGLDRLDPFAPSGRDGGVFPLGYATLMRLGAASRAGGDLPNAVSLYRRASSIDGDLPAPYVAIGNTLLEMGSVDEAIVAFNAALRVQPRDAEALRGLARAYLKTGRPELAGQPLGVAFEDNPKDPRLLQL